MRKLLVALAATALSALPAQAAVNFSDDFGDNGTSVLNYNSFANWDVENGTVDLITAPNQWGISCVSGSCVDLDGSTGQSGTLITKQIFSVAAGEQITVKFDISGNQRNLPADDAYYGFRFLSPAAGDSEIFLGTFQPGDGFSTYIATGSYAFDTQFQLFFRNVGGDNEGVILDNVSLTANAVPEPATWAMMLVGFGVVGTAIRRRPAKAMQIA